MRNKEFFVQQLWVPGCRTQRCERPHTNVTRRIRELETDTDNVQYGISLLKSIHLNVPQLKRAIFERI